MTTKSVRWFPLYVIFSLVTINYWLLILNFSNEAKLIHEPKLRRYINWIYKTAELKRNESYNIGSSWQKFWGFQETASNFHCGSKDLFWIKKHFIIRYVYNIVKDKTYLIHITFFIAIYHFLLKCLLYLYSCRLELSNAFDNTSALKAPKSCYTLFLLKYFW